MRATEFLTEKIKSIDTFIDRLTTMLLADLKAGDTEDLVETIYEAFRNFKERPTKSTVDLQIAFKKGLDKFRSESSWHIIKDSSWLHVCPHNVKDVPNDPGHDYKLYLSFDPNSFKFGNEFTEVFDRILQGISNSADPLIKNQVHQAKICTNFSTLLSDVDNMIFYSDSKDTIKQLYKKIIEQDVIGVAKYFDTTDRDAQVTSSGLSFQRSAFGKDEKGSSDSHLRAQYAAEAIIKLWPRIKHNNDSIIKNMIATQIASYFDSSVGQEEW